MSKLSSSAVAVLLLTLTSPVYAYLGPGGVVSGLGSFLALVAAVLVAIVGFLWFPMKRLIKRRRGMQDSSGNKQGSNISGED